MSEMASMSHLSGVEPVVGVVITRCSFQGAHYSLRHRFIHSRPVVFFLHGDRREAGTSSFSLWEVFLQARLLLAALTENFGPSSEYTFSCRRFLIVFMKNLGSYQVDPGVNADGDGIH